MDVEKELSLQVKRQQRVKMAFNFSEKWEVKSVGKGQGKERQGRKRKGNWYFESMEDFF